MLDGMVTASAQVAVQAVPPFIVTVSPVEEAVIAVLIAATVQSVALIVAAHPTEHIRKKHKIVRYSFFILSSYGQLAAGYAEELILIISTETC